MPFANNAIQYLPHMEVMGSSVHSGAQISFYLFPRLFSLTYLTLLLLTLTGCLLKVEKNYEQSKSTLEG